MSDPMDATVLKMQRDDLAAALRKVLDTHDREVKAAASYQAARENFSDSSDERNDHAKAMRDASNAEQQARVLLLTINFKVGQ